MTPPPGLAQLIVPGKVLCCQRAHAVRDEHCADNPAVRWYLLYQQYRFVHLVRRCDEYAPTVGPPRWVPPTAGRARGPPPTGGLAMMPYVELRPAGFPLTGEAPYLAVKRARALSLLGRRWVLDPSHAPKRCPSPSPAPPRPKCNPASSWPSSVGPRM